MKTKEIKLKFLPDEKCLEIDGVMYHTKSIKYKKIDGLYHEDYQILEKVDSKKRKEDIKFLTEKLSGSVPPERIVEEILKGKSSKEIERLKRVLSRKGTTIKRHDGCLGIFIDGGKYHSEYLEIFD